MNILSDMLWAWAGVCVLGVIAAAAIVVVEMRHEQRPAASEERSQASCPPQAAGAEAPQRVQLRQCDEPSGFD